MKTTEIDIRDGYAREPTATYSIAVTPPAVTAVRLAGHGALIGNTGTVYPRENSNETNRIGNRTAARERGPL